MFVNGILNFPGHAENWNGRAVTWTHQHSDHRAEKFEYLVGPVDRALGQKHRAEKLAALLRGYGEKGFDIVLVGHSNGCDVICDALQKSPCKAMSHMHLLSAACDADFGSNGLNAVTCPITVWRATQDRALKLAGNPFGRLLGYGTLGLDGPKNNTRHVEVIDKPFGHSGWFAGQELDRTLERIVDDR